MMPPDSRDHSEWSLAHPLPKERRASDRDIGRHILANNPQPSNELSRHVHEPSPTMYMHYTLSEDHSGGDDCVRGAILARLGAREERSPVLSRLQHRSRPI